MLCAPELAERAGIDFDDVDDVSSAPSWDLTVDDMLELAHRVRLAVDRGVRSVVVTHGTDTLEEAAWLTDLLLGADRRLVSRVVFTGAMRFSDADGSDGAENLTFAARTANRPSIAGRGVQVAFANERHAARWVRKVDASKLNPFTSDGRPSASGTLPPTAGDLERRVTMITANAVVRNAVPDGLKGLVLRGTGAGHVPSAYFAMVEDLWARGVPVVIASRSRDVLRTVGDRDRVLWAGDLTPEKAVLALMAALGRSGELDDVTHWWSTLLDSAVR